MMLVCKRQVPPLASRIDCSEHRSHSFCIARIRKSSPQVVTEGCLGLERTRNTNMQLGEALNVMPGLRRSAYLPLCLELILCASGAGQSGSRKIVGYYYGKGRPGYQVSQVPVQELTHLIYSHARPTARGDCELAHPDLDTPNLLALKVLRAQNPRLLVLLSVGGWSGSTFFSDIAATASARKQFSTSCLEIVEKYGLDGLDVDWEYPVTGGKRTDHRRKSGKENFVLLLSMGPERWSGQSGKELVLAKQFVHPETERQATEIGRSASGVLL